jgi:hypothetical protein
MAHSRFIPKIADCIANIERAGWRFFNYNRPFYRFEPRTVGIMWMRADGKREIVFTLTEIRDAYTNGW